MAEQNDDKIAILYTTGCPKCKILEEKLDGNGIQYIINDDIEHMKSIGVRSAPVLEVWMSPDDREPLLMDFLTACNWINGKLITGKE